MKHVLLFVLMTGYLVSAQVPQENQAALQQTKDLLKDKNARDAAIKGNSKAEAADSYVKQLTGGNSGMSEEVYALATEVFTWMSERAKGDPEKMQKEIEQFTSNPSAFAESWPADKKAKLKELANKLNRKPSMN
jgi:hypothetical protein